MDLQALLTNNLLASLGVGYNDTKIKDPGLAVVGVCAVHRRPIRWTAAAGR